MVYFLLVVIVVLSLGLWIERLKSRRLSIILSESQRALKEKSEAEDSGQARFEAIVSSMVEGVLVVDHKGRVLLMNPSLRKSFLVEDDPQGRRLLEVLRHVAIQDIVDELLRDTSQKLISQEIVLAVPEEKFLKVNAVPIVRDQQTEGAILVFHDITELRRLERVRQDFVANVSHELRTPLSSIKGYAETLLEGALEDKDNARDFVQIIYQDSERLSKLIDDLLDMAKIESGKMRMVFLAQNFSSVVGRVVAVLENLAKVKSIAVTADIPGDLPAVYADETRLSQVMVNLLDNAIKYTPQGGSVRISASVDSGFVQIDVADTGIGIPENDLSRIFERFYRVDKARSREMGGTGLGLSICKHIVLAHGGQIWVESRVGRGTVFHFTIPVAKTA